MVHKNGTVPNVSIRRLANFAPLYSAASVDVAALVGLLRPSSLEPWDYRYMARWTLPAHHTTDSWAGYQKESRN
jgi:hypothetical protein